MGAVEEAKQVQAPEEIAKSKPAKEKVRMERNFSTTLSDDKTSDPTLWTSITCIVKLSVFKAWCRERRNEL